MGKEKRQKKREEREEEEEEQEEEEEENSNDMEEEEYDDEEDMTIDENDMNIDEKDINIEAKFKEEDRPNTRNKNKRNTRSSIKKKNDDDIQVYRSKLKKPKSKYQKPVDYNNYEFRSPGKIAFVLEKSLDELKYPSTLEEIKQIIVKNNESIVRKKNWKESVRSFLSSSPRFKREITSDDRVVYGLIRWLDGEEKEIIKRKLELKRMRMEREERNKWKEK